jgi:hypothetical protein
MKFVFIGLFALALPGCAQLMHGEQQPVVPKGNGEYYTSCSGAVEDWNSCHVKARKACAGEYATIKKNESAVGGRRELTFQCVR